VTEGTAGTYADAWVSRVRDDPRARLALLSRLYTVPPAVDRGYLPFRVERFFIKLVLIRVLYTHALVANPRLALRWLAPGAWLIGDPRLGMTGIFLSLSRILPARYPLDDDVSVYVDAEHSIGHRLDVGIIVPRLSGLYDWSARELGVPGLRTLLVDQGPTPAYAWDPQDGEVWHPHPSRLARAAQWAVPASGSPS
jgi:hypothetical protein